MKKNKPEINPEIICEKVSQLKRINDLNFVTVKDLASEMKIKQTDLLTFLDDNASLFKLGTKRKTSKSKRMLSVIDAYPSLEEVPGSPEFVAVRKEKYKNTLDLNYYDNYGYIHGTYIEPSRPRDRHMDKWLNTVEKLELIRQKYNLKPARYWIGGIGDSFLCEPEGGLEIDRDTFVQMVKDGWEFTGDHKYRDGEKNLVATKAEDIEVDSAKIEDQQPESKEERILRLIGHGIEDERGEMKYLVENGYTADTQKEAIREIANSVWDYIKDEVRIKDE